MRNPPTWPNGQTLHDQDISDMIEAGTLYVGMPTADMMSAILSAGTATVDLTATLTTANRLLYAESSPVEYSTERLRKAGFTPDMINLTYRRYESHPHGANRPITLSEYIAWCIAAEHEGVPWRGDETGIPTHATQQNVLRVWQILQPFDPLAIDAVELADQAYVADIQAWVSPLVDTIGHALRVPVELACLTIPALRSLCRKHHPDLDPLPSVRLSGDFLRILSRLDRMLWRCAAIIWQFEYGQWGTTATHSLSPAAQSELVSHVLTLASCGDSPEVAARRWVASEAEFRKLDRTFGRDDDPEAPF
jgi:hypothetical protein